MIEIKNLIKNYKQNGTVETKVLKGISLTVPNGQFLSIIGPSGSGKSTLLYQMSLLDHPTGGEVIIDNRSANKMSSAERARFRLENIGFVFQDYAILPELTARENVMLPSLALGLSRSYAEKIADTSLQKVGLGERLHSLPSNLSGGEQQRVSIARAISHAPKLLFADEPTANLDSANSKEVMNILIDLNNAGQTIVLVTHEEEYARMTHRTISMRDGIITDDKMN